MQNCSSSPKGFAKRLSEKLNFRSPLPPAVLGGHRAQHGRGEGKGEGKLHAHFGIRGNDYVEKPSPPAPLPMGEGSFRTASKTFGGSSFLDTTLRV